VRGFHNEWYWPALAFIMRLVINVYATLVALSDELKVIVPTVSANIKQTTKNK
jgi:hypothetical protein